MESPEETRELFPVYVEKKGNQDIKNLLYVRVGNDYKSLAELQASSEPVERKDVPGLLTTELVEENSAELGTTTRSLSASPFRVCCYIVNGVKICYPC